MVELQNEYKELGGKFKVEVEADKLKDMTEIQLNEKIGTYKDILRGLPEGKLPNMIDIVLNEEETVTTLESECDEIDAQRAKIGIGGE
jgi:major membrane immunogen (membrane-anchored lipoprotein)